MIDTSTQSQSMIVLDWKGAEREPPTFFVVTLASFLALFVGLLNWLKFENYPLFSTELITVCTVILAVAVCGSLLYVGIRPSLQPFADALLAALATDLVTSSWAWPTAAFGIALVASIKLKGKLLEIAAVFCVLASILTLLEVDRIGSAIGPRSVQENPISSGDERPAIIHIILDEYIGIAGLPKASYGDSNANFVRDFFRENGFSTFERSYSRHYHSKNAIPDILNFGRPLDWEVPRYAPRVAPELAYFEMLRGQGYDVTVIQSDYIDYCTSNRVDECVEYAGAGLGTIEQSDLSTSNKALVVLSGFANLSEMVMSLRDGYANLRALVYFGLGPKLPNLSKLVLPTASSATLRVVPIFEQRVREARPGSVIFFHALLPHYPYSLDRNCRLQHPDSWLDSRSPVSFEMRHRKYGEQIRCANRVVERALSAIKASDAGDNFVVILHGDHGSRINNLDQTAYTSTSHDDLVSSFSTLFAVRFAKPNPSSSQAVISVPSLLSELASTNFKEISVTSETSPMVRLANEDWSPTVSVQFPKEF